jgi:hypothetical protein
MLCWCPPTVPNIRGLFAKFGVKLPGFFDNAMAAHARATSDLPPAELVTDCAVAMPTAGIFFRPL